MLRAGAGVMPPVHAVMADMRIYLLSLGAGLLVGGVYSLLNVRSPAPPVVALVGLLGILIGEQLIPVGKEMLSGAPRRRVATGQSASTCWACSPGATRGNKSKPPHHAGGST